MDLVDVYIIKYVIRKIFLIIGGCKINFINIKVKIIYVICMFVLVVIN